MTTRWSARCATWSTPPSFESAGAGHGRSRRRHHRCGASCDELRPGRVAATPRQRPATSVLTLADIAQRLDLLIVAVFGRSCPSAYGPGSRTRHLPRENVPATAPPPHVQGAIPATDGTCIWLPAETGLTDAALALERFRTVALQQAMRVYRGSAAGAGSGATPLVRDLYLLIEAHAADAAWHNCCRECRSRWTPARGSPERAPGDVEFPCARQPLETWVRRLMATPVLALGTDALCSPSPERSRHMARQMAGRTPADARLPGWVASPCSRIGGPANSCAERTGSSLDSGNEATAHSDLASG
jgi:hypothetical protein